MGQKLHRRCGGDAAWCPWSPRAQYLADDVFSQSDLRVSVSMSRPQSGCSVLHNEASCFLRYPLNRCPRHLAPGAVSPLLLVHALPQTTVEFFLHHPLNQHPRHLTPAAAWNDSGVSSSSSLGLTSAFSSLLCAAFDKPIWSETLV